MAVPPIDDEIYAAAILGRPMAAFPQDAVAGVVKDRRVLVTGAGGFIGSGLVRLIASLGPSHITLVENGEFALYSIDAELAGRMPHVSRRAIYCDIRDKVALERCFAEERPDIVFHAAALKQLPLTEANPREAVLTNTIGVQNVAEAALAAGTAAMVLVSTDKAVNATSVLGATKRLAELFCQAIDADSRDTRFISVRFGNVFGSTGSVAPLFRRQIEDGGPVTLTDSRMTRYFMSLGEAAGFVLCALAVALSDHNARGLIYLLETGSAVRMADVAARMIAHAGADTDRIAIRIIGARPGERLHERLRHDVDVVDETWIPGVSRVRPRGSSLPLVRQQFAQLEQACDEFDSDRLGRLLGCFVPEFAAASSKAPALAGET